MAGRRMANPKIMLPIAAVALVVFSAIAIFIAVGHTPQSGYGDSTEAPAPTVQRSPQR